MRLGINLSYRDEAGAPLDARGITARAKMIEDAGFDAIWQPDSLVPEVQPRPDPMVWLAIAAAATTRVTLGTAVYIVPFRNPLELAQRVMSLQLVSNARFAFGVGAGSNDVSLALGGIPFEERFTRLHQIAGTVRALTHGEQVADAYLNPWPETAGGPPVMLGAWGSEISLKRAVRDYDGWICSAARTSLKVIRDAISRYRDLGGTRAMVGTCPVDLTAPYQPVDEDAPFTLRCPPEAAAERIQQLVDLGFDDLGLQKVDSTSKRWEADTNADQLAEIRALLPY
ncbi:MAG: Coenzyme F420-dependent N10-methylene tetrahydromethanopterin reductase-like protein [Microbacteriaceae bacterium]|jgi:alkanesulfonate monooxygenase SsuD/methylene tetrahydromethanopterin reductase-like flavin-dependent oxidoreductase (luciferase family)|nr:Coenzyme F420-dependent N10-methylene tetrahydromethanopterin reductase-like protein [Microbacteriaceae bacterium]